ncbi:hypothetical protein [Gandjariella thermophila]|uniref:Uncharacterized protein n=1 Tax=Gandjariella thermophila TaxID=1931992 RepID=A0A4D4J9X7_9PSEU|nr:hypothetical protein [Gandjariella thermophila]GDY30633.1 hypothetical protein GTS_22660 [Gandjariella thermophila]
MSDGFDAVADELRRAAGSIADAVGGVAGMVWQGPSGDYGHRGVQAGWARFVEDLKAQIQKLHDRAHQHGDNLIAAAAGYLESDAEADAALDRVAGLLDSAGSAAGVATGGGGAGAPGGFVNPDIARRLNPGMADSTAPAGNGNEGPLY